MYAIYGVFGLLSIVASLGFSLTITAKSAALSTSEEGILSAQRAAIVQKLNDIEEQDVIERVLIDEYEPYVIELARVKEAETEYTNADRARALALSQRDRQVAGSEEWEAANREFLAADSIRVASARAQSTARTARDNIVTRFTDRKTSSGEARSRLNAELSMLIQQAGLTSDIGTVALLEIDRRISDHEQETIKKLGMQYMFVELGRYLHWESTTVKFCILMLISILIEMTILQTSPTLRITRPLLFFFRGSLPKNEDELINILNEFDHENEIYTQLAPTQIEPDPVPPSPPEPESHALCTIPKTRRAKECHAFCDGECMNETQCVPKVRKPRVKHEPIQEQEPEPASEPVQEPISESAPVQEIESEPEKHTLPDIRAESPDNTKSIHYRFGQTSEQVKDAFVSFVRACIGEKGPFKHDPLTASQADVRVPDRLRDIFLRRLLWLHLDNLPLIFEQDGTYFANFDCNTIIEYATEIVS
jgi:hypothetical protein